MILYLVEILKNRLKYAAFVLIGCSVVGFSSNAVGLDLLPNIFKNSKINRNIWKQQEQYVALAPQAAEKVSGLPKNQHPIILNIDEVRDSLKSLELWVEGGFFRNEEAVDVLSAGQISTLVRYLVEGLAQAKPDEDIVFNVRGYGNVALDVVREKYWTAGRAFYLDDKLNVIIGTYHAKKDRGIKQAEGAHGILNNTADIRFDHGNRDSVARMPGRIVTTPGVTLNEEHGSERPDWVRIDVSVAMAAYRESLIPEEDRKRDAKVKQEAAKLTVERRQMREEMARLRKELDKMKTTGSAPKDLEQRLGTLKDLMQKNLITADEFKLRRQAILEEI